MNRRQFLRYSAMIGIGTALPHSLMAATDSWRAAFAQRAAANPFLEGYKGVSQALNSESVPVDGKIPPAFRGTLYRNGPAMHETGGLRYRHWFDGDGMVHAFHFSDVGVSHKGRFVQTNKHVKESRSGKPLYNGYGTQIPDSLPITGPDDVNTANTSVLPHADELLALWEGGSAYRLDPRSLETLGTKIWRSDLQGAAFSAHPKIDPEGTLWNFGLDVRTSTMVLYRISAKGKLLKASLLRTPNLAMIHDFAITARHLVFLVPPMRFHAEKFFDGATILDAHEWIADAPMRVLIVDKDDFRTHRWFELPSGFLFHFGNAWEESGTIRFDYVRLDDASSLTLHMRELMRGNIFSHDVSETHLVTLNMGGGAIRQERFPGIVEFPRVDPRVVGERYRQLYSVARTVRDKPHRGANAIQRHDLDTGKVDVFDYGREFMVEEHVVVPKPGTNREGDAWLVGTALDTRRRHTVLSIFEALHLGAGPIAQAILPYALPLGFHGNFQMTA